MQPSGKNKLFESKIISEFEFGRPTDASYLAHVEELSEQVAALYGTSFLNHIHKYATERSLTTNIISCPEETCTSKLNEVSKKIPFSKYK